MNSDRIKMLEQFIADDPNDPFNHYALALELMKSDKDQAKKIFDQLISAHPEYVPSYYQAALLYLEFSLSDEAVKIINQGITEAKKQNELKALNELRSLLDEMD
ncbi:MAG: tetratricopeptide repeat protein [Bacteroidetes bacterium]|nr:tetratricopeptide repeat protein [Bacteroidota bacterium]MBI3481752.1 tetratricopeptide repeat protein [Bacteroidota bacterium]